MEINYILYRDNTYGIHFNKNNINIAWFYSDEKIIHHWDDDLPSVVLKYLNELGIKIINHQ